MIKHDEQNKYTSRNFSQRFAHAHLHDFELTSRSTWSALDISTEGLHNAVRTYTHTILPCPLDSFLHGAG